MHLTPLLTTLTGYQVDVESIVSSLLSNVDLAQLGFGGLLGYVVGWGFKKLVRVISVIIGVTLAFVAAILLYLNAQGLITINYNRFGLWIVNVGQWVLGIAESALQSARSTLGPLSLVGGLLVGFILGFKKG